MHLKRDRPGLEYSPPIGREGLLSQARREVELEIEASRRNLEMRRDRQIERLIEVGPKNEAPSLKKDVYAVVERAQALRHKARAHFKKHRADWIGAAEDRGEQNPEESVAVRQANRLKAIDKAEHRTLHQVFKNHGIDRVPTPTPAMNQAGPKMAG